MSFPPRSEYFALRARDTRRLSDEATDPSLVEAYGEMADRYQAVSDSAKIIENGGISDDPTHHDEREDAQRELGGAAGNDATRDFHNDAADRHDDKASSIRKAAKLTGDAIRNRLMGEVAAEERRSAAAMADYEERHPHVATCPVSRENGEAKFTS